MKINKKWLWIGGAMLLVVLIILSGIFGSTLRMGVAKNEMYDGDMMPMDEPSAIQEGVKTKEISPGLPEKQITRVSYSLSTKKFDEDKKQIQDIAASFQAKLSRLDEGTLGYDKESRLRYLSIEFRVPTDKLEEFLAKLEENRDIDSKNYNVEDVTKHYYDVEGRLKNLESRQARLRALYDKAETIEDLVHVEEALSQVSYEIDNLTSQKSSIDRDVDYTVVSISLNEVLAFESLGGGNFGSSLVQAFYHGIMIFVRGVKELLLLVAILWPFLLLAFILAMIVIKVKGRKKAAKEKKE